MPKRSETSLGTSAGPPDNTSNEDRLLWRAGLGQATYELLRRGEVVTLPSLVERLEREESGTHMELRRKSASAALSLLRTLEQTQQADRSAGGRSE